MVEAVKRLSDGPSIQLDEQKLTSTNDKMPSQLSDSPLVQQGQEKTKSFRANALSPQKTIEDTTPSSPTKTVQYIDNSDFQRQVNAWFEHGDEDTTIALFALELADFSLVKDVLGERISNAIIEHAILRLAINGPQNSVFTAQDSGRMFVAVRDIEQTEVIWKIANQLLEILEKPASSALGDIQLQPYVGMSILPLIAVSLDELMRNAVVALAHAKEDSRENVCLYETLKANNTKRTLLRLFELKRALADKIGIETYYQPKQALSDDRIVGLEALVRWHHPKEGLIPPLDFIELAEEKGIICQITNRVIETVCRDFKYLKQLGFDGVISINISAKDFDRPSFIQDLCNAVRAHGIPPKNIELEITETAFIHDFNRCSLVLCALREIGFKLTIDDFGKGYSALSYLKKLPVDTIKIDKEFISNIEHSKEVQSVFEALLKIAHTQNLEVVAEGVETIEQKNILKKMKCDQIQGYLLSKPLPLNEFHTWRFEGG